MQSPMRRLIIAFAAAFALGTTALAQTNRPPDDPPGGKGAAGAPPGFVAPAEPKPDETNAQRGESQPGNNAPFWRGVRESGNTPGFTTCPTTRRAPDPALRAVPRLRFTTAGEAWRQVRNKWIIPYGGALLLIVLLAIALFYWRKGRSAPRDAEPAAASSASRLSSAPRTGPTPSPSSCSRSRVW